MADRIPQSDPEMAGRKKRTTVKEEHGARHPGWGVVRPEDEAAILVRRDITAPSSNKRAREEDGAGHGLRSINARTSADPTGLQRSEATRSTAGADEEKACRICFGGAEDGPLVQPCACRGSSSWVHAGHAITSI